MRVFALDERMKNCSERKGRVRNGLFRGDFFAVCGGIHCNLVENGGGGWRVSEFGRWFAEGSRFQELGV